MMLKHIATEVMRNDKVAATVAAVTTSTGTATWFEWIPGDVGKLATLVGIALSLVLIYTHWRKHQIEYHKIKLEADVLAEKEFERIARAESRRKQGLATTRKDDQG